MQIRKANKSDIPIIQKIADQSWRENYPGIISEEQINYMLDLMYSEKEITRHFKNPNYHYFIIEIQENKPVGILGFENDYEEHTTKLHRIYLLKSEKGKGLGKLAINFLKDWVRKSGNTRIILNVNKNNPAEKVYTSQGFKVYEEIVLQIGNGFVMDDYLMEFIL